MQWEISQPFPNHSVPIPVPAQFSMDSIEAEFESDSRLMAGARVAQQWAQAIGDDTVSVGQVCVYPRDLDVVMVAYHLYIHDSSGTSLVSSDSPILGKARFHGHSLPIYHQTWLTPSNNVLEMLRVEVPQCDSHPAFMAFCESLNAGVLDNAVSEFSSWLERLEFKAAT